MKKWLQGVLAGVIAASVIERYRVWRLARQAAELHKTALTTMALTRSLPEPSPWAVLTRKRQETPPIEMHPAVLRYLAGLNLSALPSSSLADQLRRDPALQSTFRTAFGRRRFWPERWTPRKVSKLS